VSPSSFVKNTFPSTATGEAENPSRCATPSRPCQIVFPVVASMQVMMLAMSLIMYRYSPYTIGEGTNGDPRGLDQTRWLRVTSPFPPGRIASVGPARPEEQNTRPCPTTGVGITS